MSSSQSPERRPAPEELDSLTSAVTEVMECSFFALAERLDVEHYGQLEACALESAPACWLIDVRFVGPWSGLVELSVPDALARQLHESFAGLMPDEVVSDEEVGQMMGELGNMVTGAWLTRAYRQYKFDLSGPIAVKHDAPPRAASTATVLFGVNDAPVCLWLDGVAEAAA